MLETAKVEFVGGAEIDRILKEKRDSESLKKGRIQEQCGNQNISSATGRRSFNEKWLKKKGRTPNFSVAGENSVFRSPGERGGKEKWKATKKELLTEYTHSWKE